jgi:hypothetical protein
MSTETNIPSTIVSAESENVLRETACSRQKRYKEIASAENGNARRGNVCFRRKLFREIVTLVNNLRGKNFRRKIDSAANDSQVALPPLVIV